MIFLLFWVDYLNNFSHTFSSQMKYSTSSSNTPSPCLNFILRPLQSLNHWLSYIIARYLAFVGGTKLPTLYFLHSHWMDDVHHTLATFGIQHPCTCTIRILCMLLNIPIILSSWLLYYLIKLLILAMLVRPITGGERYVLVVLVCVLYLYCIFLYWKCPRMLCVLHYLMHYLETIDARGS